MLTSANSFHHGRCTILFSGYHRLDEINFKLELVCQTTLRQVPEDIIIDHRLTRLTIRLYGNENKREKGEDFSKANDSLIDADIRDALTRTGFDYIPASGVNMLFK
jgi:hypothetical protein